MPPLKADGLRAKQQLTDPALLLVSPDGVKSSIVHSGGNKRRRVGGRRVEVRKGRKRNDLVIQRREDSKMEEEEVYGTIAVWTPTEVLELYKPWQREDTLPEPPGVDKIGYNEEMGNKDNDKASDSAALKETKSVGESILDEGYIGRVTYQTEGEQIIDQAAGGGLLQRGIEGDLEGGVEGHGVTGDERGENYVESLDEAELIQQAITSAIDTRNLSQPLTRADGVIKGPEHLEQSPEIEEEEEGRDEIHQQLGNQEDLILDKKTNTYKPIRPGTYDGDETESDPEQLYTSPYHRGPPETLHQGPELRSLTPSVGPTLWSPAQSPKLRRARQGPPTFPPTPASISLVDSAPPSSSTLCPSPVPSIVVGSMSLTPVTGPKRWKRPLSKQSRFSGPKIYTPLTLHPPSAGLGVVDYTRTLPLQCDEGDQRWERPMRQVSVEL